MALGQMNQEREKRYELKVADDVYEPHEVFPTSYPKYLGKAGVRFKMPILDWLTEDVMDFLAGEQNKLYSHGFNRVGCFPCLAGGDADMIRAFEFDDFGRTQREEVKKLSKIIGRSCFNSNIGKRYEAGEQIDDEPACSTDSGCSICAM